MSETVVTQPSPAEQIGLVDGQFMVQRNAPDGGTPVLEQGWQVMAVREVPDATDPSIMTAKVDIFLPGPTEETTLVKPGVPLERLQSWQPVAAEESGLDEDIVPREVLTGMGALPVGQVVEAPDYVSVSNEQSAASTPSTAEDITGADVERVVSGKDVAPLPGISDQTQAEKTKEGEQTTAEPTGQAEFEANPNIVADIAERFGLDRSSEPAVVETKLQEQLVELDGIARSLVEFVPHSKKAVREIGATLSFGDKSHLQGSTRRELKGFLDGPYGSIRALALDDAKLAALPAPIRKAIDGKRRDIIALGDKAYVMMGGNMPRNLSNAFDEGPAQQVMTTLGRIEDLSKKVIQSRVIVENELAQVIGSKGANEAHQALEKANVRAPKLGEVLRSGERTEAGAVWLRGELREAFVAALGDAATPAPSEEELRAGIARARGLVNEGGADGTLFRMPFTSNKELNNRGTMTRAEAAVFLDEPIYINPDKIIGAAGFDSWMGRGLEGSGDAGTKDGPSKTVRSIDKIKDYATRETALRVVNADDRMTLVQANNGVFLFSNSAHRSAAAKLRGEPIAVEAFEVFKFDGEI